MLGIARANRALGNLELATFANERFLDQWVDADLDLQHFTEAREFLNTESAR